MDFFNLVHYGLIALAVLFGLALLVWVVSLIVLPISWINMKIAGFRCPKCGGFKKELVSREAADEKEVLRTVNRVDRGVLHSRYLFEPNQAFEISRKEQVSFVEQTFRKTWVCRNPDCGHKWATEEYTEFEGSAAD